MLRSGVKLPLLDQGSGRKKYQSHPVRDLIGVVQTLSSLGSLDEDLQSLPLTLVNCQTMLSPSTICMPPSKHKTSLQQFLAYLVSKPYFALNCNRSLAGDNVKPLVIFH